MLTSQIWRVHTPQQTPGKSCPGRSVERVQAMVDSYHFFGRAPPWGGDCGACALRGLPCNEAQLHKRWAWRHAIPCGFGEVQSLWYSTFLKLPAEIRSVCYRRIVSAAALEMSGRAKGMQAWAAGAGCALT